MFYMDKYLLKLIFAISYKEIIEIFKLGHLRVPNPKTMAKVFSVLQFKCTYLHDVFTHLAFYI